MASEVHYLVSRWNQHNTMMMMLPLSLLLPVCLNPTMYELFYIATIHLVPLSPTTIKLANIPLPLDAPIEEEVTVKIFELTPLT